MRTYITIVLLFLALANTQCKKDNNSDNRTKELQGSWRLAFTAEVNGPVYPAPGTLTILKFDGYKMLTYAHDTLLKTEQYDIVMMKDTVSGANIPSIVPKNSPYSGLPKSFSVHNDTLNIYLLHSSDGRGSTYIRYNR